MLTKVTLSGVACYKSPVSLETDKRINLIYGLNGTGKSTFTRYLANIDDPQFDQCHVESSQNLADVEFLVYDEDYIEANFYQSDIQKGIFSLSKENKEAKLKIENANREIERLSGLVSESNEKKRKVADEFNQVKDNAAKTIWDIKRKYYGGDRVLEEFLKGHVGSSQSMLEYLYSIPLPTEEPKLTIEQIKDQLQKLNDAAGTPLENIHQLVLASIDEIIGDKIWKRVIVGNENSSVSAVINRLGNSDWVKRGLQYLPEGDITGYEICPFCQQPTISQKLISELRGYFDENYEKDLQTLKDLMSQYQSIFEGVVAIPDFKNNPHISHLSTEYEIKLLALQTVMAHNMEVMQMKVNNLSISVDFQSHAVALADVNSVIRKAREIIRDFNHKLENINVEKGKLRREFWNINRLFYDQTLKAIDEKYQLQTQIFKAEDAKIKEFEQQIEHQKRIVLDEQKNVINIQMAIDHINDTLVDIGIADIVIEPAGDNNYRIKRRGETTSPFRSFSEGERMLISFLYFMEQTKGKISPEATDKKKIIVVDDPISSLSHIHIFNIGRLIRQLFDNDSLEQVFVLTHSLYFLYELTDTNHSRREEKQALHRFYKNAEGTHIVKMKYEEIQNDYHTYWSIVNDKDQSPALIANCMRNILDYFFGFVEKLEYNNLFSQAGISGSIRFQAFNRYMNRESHSIGQNVFDIKEFDYDSFREALRLMFVKNGYEKHYLKMSKIGGLEI